MAIRGAGWNYGQNQERNFNHAPARPFICTTRNGYHYTLKYSVGFDDPRVQGVINAVEAVPALNFPLPKIEFRVNPACGNIAIKGGAAGNFSVIVYIGGAAIHQDKKVFTHKLSGVVGGQGMNRGVAHQIYDNTQRWFGNPRQHAMAATVVFHELGHVLREATDADMHWESMNPEYRPDVWKVPSRSVSQYAGKSGGELVAGVFAGTMAGKKYPGAVVAAYRALHGPEVARFFG